jgi:cytochrome b involved in lipid metabolism
MGADIYSPEQVSTHNDAADLWITIDQEVYDLSNFIEEHPGGANSVFKGRLSYLVVF